MRKTMIVAGMLALTMASHANVETLELTALAAGTDKNILSFEDNKGCKYAAKQWFGTGKSIELTLQSCNGGKLNIVSYRSAVIEAPFEKGAKIVFSKN